MRLLITLVFLITISSCSTKFYCKRCPITDSTIVKIDTTFLPGDTITRTIDCKKDTTITDSTGRTIFTATVEDGKLYFKITEKPIQLLSKTITITKTRPQPKPVKVKEMPFWGWVIVITSLGIGFLLTLKSIFK